MLAKVVFFRETALVVPFFYIYTQRYQLIFYREGPSKTVDVF